MELFGQRRRSTRQSWLLSDFHNRRARIHLPFFLLLLGQEHRQPKLSRLHLS